MSIGTGPRAQSLSEGSNRPVETLTLRLLRQRRGMSIRDVESVTRINRARLSMIERGLEKPSRMMLNALSEVYGVEVEHWEPFLEYRIPEALT